MFGFQIKFDYSMTSLTWSEQRESKATIRITTCLSEQGSVSRCINGGIRKTQLCPDQIYNEDERGLFW